jgi:hypothetical protein
MKFELEVGVPVSSRQIKLALSGTCPSASLVSQGLRNVDVMGDTVEGDKGEAKLLEDDLRIAVAIRRSSGMFGAFKGAGLS